MVRDVLVKYEKILHDGRNKNAIWFAFDPEEKITCWLPKSQIEVDTEDKNICMPEWLMENNNLGEYEET